MNKLFARIFLVLAGLIAFSTYSQAQFKEDAFTQNYNSPNDSTARKDTADVLFSFKQFFRGVNHKEDLKIGTMFGGSTLFVGCEQIYNRQYWKLPIIYGGLGATIGMGIHYRNKDDQHSKDIGKYLLAGAGLIYWGTLMDGVINYKRDIPHQPGKATIYSILVPGLGQIYNGEYWKVPIYWGCLIGSMHFISTNNTNYHRYKRIHNEATTPEMEYKGPISGETAKYYRDVYRRYRDYSIVAFLGFYLLQIIDANVFSYMRDFEISEDITMRVEPDISLPNYENYALAMPGHSGGPGFVPIQSGIGASSIGLKIGFRF